MGVDERVDIVARTIYGEARGQPYFDRLAVGFVIYEREKRPGWWGEGFIAVCCKDRQFACWNRGNPNLDALLCAKDKNPTLFKACVNVAEFVVYHAKDRDVAQFWGTNDPNRFPTHYIARWLRKPDWLEGGEPVPTPVDTAHLFYAGVRGTPKRPVQ